MHSWVTRGIWIAITAVVLYSVVHRVFRSVERRVDQEDGING
jgi:hypothetical protein